MYRIVTLIALVGTLLFVTEARAQLNLKIGYSLGVLNPDKTNMIFKEFNEANPWLEEKLKDLNLISGVTIGFRNRWEFVGLELSWTSKIAERKASGVDPDQNKQILRQLNFRYSSFSLGLEIYSGSIAFGGSLDASDYMLKMEVTDGEEVMDLIDDFFLTANLYINYQLTTSGVMAVSFRPYIQIPLEEVSAFGLQEGLFPNSGADPADFNENLFNFGLAFIFNNGTQSR